jgi:signal transduction histidine kinase
LRALLASVAKEVPDLKAHVAADLSVVRRVLDATPILNLNEKARSMFAVERQAAAGHRMGDWSPDSSLEAWNRVLLHYISGAESYETETVLQRDDGQPIDVLISCAYPTRPEEQMVVVVGLVDIGARIAKERELAQAHADLTHAARVATLGELMASIAHEVNQPLAAVVANGNAALRWMDRDVGEAKAAISRLINEASRASQIIARTRQMAIKGDTTRTRFDLNRLIAETIEITDRQAAALGSRVNCSFSPDLPEIVADRIQIQQVIINLIVNAAQAMADQASPRRIEITTRPSTPLRVHVEVADTGPGLGTDAARIFDAFYTTKTEGMGMGLSVAKGIIEAHDGFLNATPAETGGTVFRIDLPVGSSGAAAE